MVNLKNLSVLVFILCNLFLFTQSSGKRKRVQDLMDKKWNITPYVGMEGNLKYKNTEIKFSIEEIFKNNTKYKYLISYPDGEYQSSRIGLDLNNKKYTSPSIVGKGIIIDIQHFQLNIHDDSEVSNEEENEEYFKDHTSISSREEDIEEKIKTNKNFFSGLQTLADIDLTKWKIIPFIKMKGIYRYCEHEISFVIEKIDKKEKYKYFVSYPNNDYPKEWLNINFKKKTYSTKRGETYDFVKIYDPKVETKHKKPIENFNENMRLAPSTGGVLLPNPTTVATKETKIQFSIIKVEQNPQFLKNEPNKIFWVNYPHRNIMDEYIAINRESLTYSDSKHFGEGSVQLRKQINDNCDQLYWSD